MVKSNNKIKKLIINQINRGRESIERTINRKKLERKGEQLSAVPACKRSTMQNVDVLNFRVRNGFGWDHVALTVRR